jgi:predicted metal-dependent enzyme (double-stranded beta helix superfamily)
LERHTTRDSADGPGERVHLARSTAAFGPDHVHSVAAAGTAPALSIHVYSPPLLTMTHYDVAPGSIPIATSTEVC